MAEAPAAAPVVISADEDGFQIQSPDESFTLRIRGDAQTDGRFFAGDAEELGVDQLYLRRARVNLQGTLGGRYDFKLMPNFGQGRVEIQDAYLDARFTPALAVQAGKFKVPLGLEWLRSPADLHLVELGLPSALVPRRDVGVMVHGRVAGGRLSYELGAFDGALDGQNADGDATDGKDVAARLFAQPFLSGGGVLRGLGLGLAATWGEESGSLAAPAVASYRSVGGRMVDRLRTGTADSTTVVADGARVRYSPQGYLYSGPASLVAEVVVSTQAVRLGAASADLTAMAWQVVGGYVLTGERATYGRLRPAHPLDGSGGFGAVEVSARYGELRYDDDAFPLFASPTANARRTQAWAVGLSWYPTANVRAMANYERTTFALPDAAGAAAALPSENLILTRFQIAF
ncbi:hypothetical protein BSZ37_11500 [Rubrivirga marina]|uniref:Porin n=1 Tax=Rubrivirga marina TaxID=1196024 RepID=A0A271J5E9_9BACT|nr:hypothetical protein BSZ37_11500 [Rubrivirga marina]